MSYKIIEKHNKNELGLLPKHIVWEVNIDTPGTTEPYVEIQVMESATMYPHQEPMYITLITMHWGSGNAYHSLETLHSAIEEAETPVDAEYLKEIRNVVHLMFKSLDGGEQWKQIRQ